MVPNAKSMDSQREPKACDAILQAVGQRSQVIPEVLSMIQCLQSRVCQGTRMFVLGKTKQTGIRLTYKAFPSLGSAEREKSTAELDAARTTAKTLAMQLKFSRYAEEKVYSAYTDLRSRAEASQVSIGEDMRAVSRNTELLSF